MSPQGKEIPDPIKEFIIREKRNAPDLKQAQLAAKVEGKFGQRIDKSTVGRYLRKNKDQIAEGENRAEPAGTVEGSQELELHRRDLFYFGQLLRDRLELLAPHQALNQWTATSEEAGMALWSGRLAIPDRDPAGLSEEEWSVEDGWKSGPFNARVHPQFPFFREHLAGSSLWKNFDRLDDQFRDYFQTCQAVFTKTAGEVEKKLPGLPEVDVRSVAMSVLASASGGALTQNPASDFSYPVQQETSGDDIWWSLRLGAWYVRARYPEDLNQLVNVHNILLVDASQWVEFLSMRTHRAACQETILEFQKALTPDVTLRHLLTSGSCDVCLRERTANAELAKLGDDLL